MTTRGAGRHRRHVDLRRPPSLLLLDYESIGAGAFTLSARPQPGTGPAGGRRALRAALARDRRMFVIALSATLVSITAAAAFGAVVPLHSTRTAGGGRGAEGIRPPQASVPWSAGPLGSPSGQAAPLNPPRSASAAPSRRPHAFGYRPRGSRITPAASRTIPAGRATPAAGTGPAIGAGPAAASKKNEAASRPAQSARQPRLVVTYLVDSQWLGGFQGQVQVVNHGARPIAGWQIVVALPADTVTSVWNAAGFDSNHILLIQPAETTEVVPAHGTLDVFFTAQGAETAPAACAFDGIPCR